jgi:CRP/FNR family transcriptional regulator, nitrogen fixation regulation protein
MGPRSEYKIPHFADGASGWGRTAKHSGQSAQRDLSRPSVAADPLDKMTGVAMSFARNGEIYGQNEPADHIYKIISGTVRTYKIFSDGRRQIGAFYLAGDVFGLEMGVAHTFSAEAINGARVLVVKLSAVIELAGREHDVAPLLWALTARELLRVQDHSLLLTKSAQERVASFLIEMVARLPAGNTVELPMSRRDIADYLGLTVETVCRTLTQLENTAAIAQTSSRRIVLRNRAALQRLNG